MPNTLMNFMTTLRPFEFTVPDIISMYDHMPYKCDVNLCNRSTISLESGNIIKRYRYNIVKCYDINNCNN